MLNNYSCSATWAYLKDGRQEEETTDEMAGWLAQWTWASATEWAELVNKIRERATTLIHDQRLKWLSNSYSLCTDWSTWANSRSSHGILDVSVSLPPDKWKQLLGDFLSGSVSIHLPLQGTQVPPWATVSPHAAEAGPCSAVHPPRACAEVHARQLEKAPAKQQRPKAVKTVFKN